MPYLLQPDSGGNCCDCPDRETPCEDCTTCPRDITDLSSVTLETTIEVTDTSTGCTSLSYSTTKSKSWTRVARYDGGGGFLGNAGPGEFQVFKDNSDGCCNTQFYVGDTEDNFFSFPVTGLQDDASCGTGSPIGQDGDTDIGGSGSATISNAGDCAIEDNFVISGGSFLHVACLDGEIASCTHNESVYDDPIPDVSSPTLAGLIGTYTVEDTFTGTGYSVHIKTVITIA